ncbi:recombinase family protein [Niabella sp. W65]|nr:recombinase family protein [Niabella sp. W65]MCH7367242.1 recombinase family protein [Niabella sp. W65]
MEKAKEKGLKCSKNNFWVAIRNPIYCGLIFVPKYKEEESLLAKGQHEPLISEALFYDVQDVLDGRKRILGTKVTADDSIPLRGFLICPKCGRMLTASASKGEHNITITIIAVLLVVFVTKQKTRTIKCMTRSKICLAAFKT